jgi:uncharacterized protein YukE
VAAVTDDQGSSQQGSSSGEPLQVDTDKMKSAIPKLQALADRLQAAGKDLQSTCDAIGPKAWGDDKSGKAFFAKYQEPQAQAMAASFQAGSVLSDSTKQVDAMVRAFEAAEDYAKSQGSSLSSSIENPAP